MAKMVLAVAESLELAVIAEGVETEAQKNFLLGLGCHAFQGNFTGRSMWARAAQSSGSADAAVMAMPFL